MTIELKPEQMALIAMFEARIAAATEARDACVRCILASAGAPAGPVQIQNGRLVVEEK